MRVMFRFRAFALVLFGIASASSVLAMSGDGCALHGELAADSSKLPATVLILPPEVGVVHVMLRGTAELASEADVRAAVRQELEVRLRRRGMSAVQAESSPVPVGQALYSVVKSSGSGNAKLFWAKPSPIRKGQVTIGPVLAEAAKEKGAGAVLWVELRAASISGGAAFFGASPGCSLDAWLVRASDGVVLYHGTGGSSDSPLKDFNGTLEYLMGAAFLDLPTRPAAQAAGAAPASEGGR